MQKRKKRPVIGTMKSSSGKKHYDITVKANGQLDCSCFSQRYRTFKKGAKCCKHLTAWMASA